MFHSALYGKYYHVAYQSLSSTIHLYMSRIMRKPAICICENKGADQLRGNREADQRLCFRYTDSTIPLLPKYEISCFYLSPVLVQLGLCRTCLETTTLVFPRGGAYYEECISVSRQQLWDILSSTRHHSLLGKPSSSSISVHYGSCLIVSALQILYLSFTLRKKSLIECIKAHDRHMITTFI